MRSSNSLDRLDVAFDVAFDVEFDVEFDGTQLVADAGSAPGGRARPAARRSGGAPRSPVAGHRGLRVMTDSDGTRGARSRGCES